MKVNVRVNANTKSLYVNLDKTMAIDVVCRRVLSMWAAGELTTLQLNSVSAGEDTISVHLDHKLVTLVQSIPHLIVSKFIRFAIVYSVSLEDRLQLEQQY